jgi:hypothetical protein
MSNDLDVTRGGYSIGELESIAEQLAASGLWPGVDTKQSAFALLLICQAEQTHPVLAMKRYHIIEGRPAMRADAMQAEFQRAGGLIQWVRSDAEICEAVFTHPVQAREGVTVRVTFAELDAAGVTKGKYGVKDNWRKFPRQMLRARAISEGVRMVLPGVVAGIYTPEEVADFEPLPPRTVAARLEQPVAPAPAQPALESPAPATKPRKQVPITGKELIDRLQECEKAGHLGLILKVSQWATVNNFEGKMADWDRDLVRLAYQHAVELVKGKAATPVEREPGED